jgi:NAD(P)-dependent dehydrogenase (short-subunit alcohol dehydrogenase family)
MRNMGRCTLFGRMPEPVEIARVVTFVCTEDAGAIRGHVIVVDSGYTLFA